MSKNNYNYFTNNNNNLNSPYSDYEFSNFVAFDNYKSDAFRN